MENIQIGESEEKRHIDEQIYFIKYASDTVRAMRSIDARADLGKVWKRIRRRSRRDQTVWIQRAAAAACLLLATAFVYLQWSDKHSGLISAVEVHVPEGSISSILLPDGSKVWLNADTKLSYDNGFGINNRKIKLTGEGFFDVKANIRIPFEVEAGEVIVIAKGTQFNVKAYPDDNMVTAILTEGVIEIISSYGQGESKTISQPGQMVVHSRQSPQYTVETPTDDVIQTENTNEAMAEMAVEKVANPDMYTAWKEKRWMVEGATLAELAPILQRRYAVKLVFDSNVLKTYKFRGEISNISVEQMAKALQLTAPMNYRMSNDTIFFAIDMKRKQEFDRFLR